ncbi:unnamed protein product [Oppiella nova]|uniref:Cytochrome P450 n=1 Tax=Oppiella nova TaxID=334625 RepID=A0A7R9LWD7_9ACAR|nr:unnamed protein product [Oppiella nova]CAG2167622.1 unnamed protein product [Oppiella nova]
MDYFRRKFTYWKRMGVPGPNLFQYKSLIHVHHDFTLDQVTQYGKLYGSYTMAAQKLIVVCEPDLLRDILVKDSHLFTDRRHFHLGSSKITKSLFFVPGDDDWKRQRHILSPVFTSRKLRAMMAHISDISDKFVHNLTEFEKQGDPIDIRKYVGAFAMDVISACAYGINTDSIDNPNHPIVTNAMKILNTDAGVGFMLSVMVPKIAKYLGAEPFDIKAVQYFDELTNQILNERKVSNNYLTVTKTKRRTDFIQLMIDSEKSDKELGYSSHSDVEPDESTEPLTKRPTGQLTPDELTAQGILFFIAGYDTTSAAITHAIYYLSLNKDCQQSLYDELKTCDEFTYEKLGHLKYLNAVINETLRLAPSLTRTNREALQDYKLGNTGITIPKGTSVEIVPYALHRQPDLWPNPNDFIPGRWLEPTHHPYAYLPFGGGPRVCIGQRFALNEMRMCLAKLVHKFEFNLAEPNKQTKLELLRRRFTYWSRKGVPGPNFVEYDGFFTIHHEYTLKAIQKYGRVYGSYSLVGKALVVCDPNLLRDIMVKDFNVFPDHKHFHTGSSKLDKSLFFMPGDDDWKRVRSILSPVFTSGKLRAMMAHISDISDSFVNNLGDYETKGEVVDMRKYIGAFAMDVISACAYGINTESVKNTSHPIVTNAKKILGVDAGIGILLSILAPGLAKLLKLEPFDINAINYFDELTNQILKERKVINKYKVTDKCKMTETKRRTDFIQLMIDSEKSAKDLGYDSNSDVEPDEPTDPLSKRPTGQLTSDELTAQGILFFIAGYDTTSAALSHAIYYLSEQKSCQQKLYDELKSCDEFTYEKLGHFKYLNAVISETLRLAPSLTRVQRECLQDYKLADTGITIPKGTSIEILPYAIHRDPEYWPNPNDFIPDRFLEPTHHPYAYLPFGGGPRLCIGQRFALNEMRMCLAKLIHKYEFTLAQKPQMDYFIGNILMSPKELLVTLKARD